MRGVKISLRYIDPGVKISYDILTPGSIYRGVKISSHTGIPGACASCNVTYLARGPLWCHMVTKIWVNIDWGNGLLLDGTKALPEPTLTYHQWGSLVFTWGQIHGNHSWYYSLQSVSKLLIWKHCYPGADELIIFSGQPELCLWQIISNFTARAC